jgi:hypothetical protein
MKPEKFFQRCYDDFGFFYTEFAWPALNGDTYIEAPYVSDLLIEYGVAFEAKVLRKVLVAIPPRNGKTTLFTIALPLWSWLRNPGANWATISATQVIIKDFYSDRSKLMRSDVYLAMMSYFHDGNFLPLVSDSVYAVENTIGGKHYQWTMHNTRIGLGCDYMVIDDPTPTGRAKNRLYNAKTEREFKTATLSRRQDKAIGSESPVMVVQQRVGAMDLIGCMKDTDGWEYLELQAIAEEKTIFTFPMSGKVWVREEGSVLNPERESLETLNALRSESVDGGFQAQYQQRPEHTEGAIVKAEDIRYYNKPQESYVEIMMSADCAGTTASYSSNWGLTIWGVKSNKEMDLLYCHAKKYEYPEGKKLIISLIKEWDVDWIVIEPKSTGVALIPELKDLKICKVISYVLSKAHKDDRILEALPSIKRFCILPNLVKNPTAVWVGLFTYELFSFPNSSTDDLLDSATMAVLTVNPMSKKVTNFKKFYGF